jgi:hypothetical protein
MIIPFSVESVEFDSAIQRSLISDKKVIPAPYQVRGKLQQESRKTLDSPVSSTGQACQARNDRRLDTYVVMYKN